MFKVTDGWTRLGRTTKSNTDLLRAGSHRDLHHSVSSSGEAGLDPVVALHAFRWIDLLCGIVRHIRHRELAVDRLGHAIHRWLDTLMTLAQRHLRRAARRFETQALESGDHLLPIGSFAA